MKFDAVIIGAGASGLMCAASASLRGMTVALLDHEKKIGQKILISGGGRCNFTNKNISPENYYSENPDFVKAALASYSPDAFLSYLDKHDILWYEKEDGQLFLRGSPKQLVSALKRDAEKSHSKIFTGTTVEDISRSNEGVFTTKTSRETFEAKRLIVATGGLSYKKLGASDFGLKVAKQFGHHIVETKPALVGLKLGEDGKKFCALAGVSVPATIGCCGRKVAGDMLFTHTGLSGPVILKASCFWKAGAKLSIELPQNIPQRLTKIIGSNRLITLSPVSTEGYDRAEVTLGGVDTIEIEPLHFESKLVKGLYFIGEVLDVTGDLGGYNLHWAWASGHQVFQV